mmetsp:Transcript_2956/g.5635  ORF Transcript_2956/g.5635 Transcript_2956/m.5635 type:complete len:195 (-) Transcript_2956:443-1027(-)|eukprot:CAMPEP_0184683530 /NCGR_PEP_ID=MMETSP0312-20130426/11681_1 /TAXON_ID=31354 /ORGANISM="Compsopogon coeruleus, Strain SAG 36.94" /LENGTH=194 /DNA_ID=CAMNT_0027135961 /DNA_START=84 /DNA_END=668 /DNA_ORIENTATION=+
MDSLVGFDPALDFSSEGLDGWMRNEVLASEEGNPGCTPGSMDSQPEGLPLMGELEFDSWDSLEATGERNESNDISAMSNVASISRSPRGKEPKTKRARQRGSVYDKCLTSMKADVANVYIKSRRLRDRAASLASERVALMEEHMFWTSENQRLRQLLGVGSVSLTTRFDVFPLWNLTSRQNIATSNPTKHMTRT